MDMSFSCRKNAFFQAPIKLAQPFPAPELRTENFTDTRIFLIKNVAFTMQIGEAKKKAAKEPHPTGQLRDAIALRVKGDLR